MNKGHSHRQSYSNNKKNNQSNDSIGNRYVGRQVNTIDDNIGNRKVLEREERVLHDSVGNSLDRETHILSNSFPRTKNNKRGQNQPASRRAPEENRQQMSRQQQQQQAAPKVAQAPKEQPKVAQNRVPQPPRAKTPPPQAKPAKKKNVEAELTDYSPESQVQRLIYLNDIFNYPLKISLDEKLESSRKIVVDLLERMKLNLTLEVRVFNDEQPLVSFMVSQKNGDAEVENRPVLLRDHAVLFALNYLVSRMINRDAENRIWFILVPKSYEAQLEAGIKTRGEAKMKKDVAVAVTES